MKEEIYISVCWYDTLKCLRRYIDSRTMKAITENGFNKEDTIKILKVSTYLIKLAEEEHISKSQYRHTIIKENVIRKDHKGPNHDRWVTFS